MWKCKYCGENAGFFRRKHKECEENYITNKVKIGLLASDALNGLVKIDGLKKKIDQIAHDCSISEDDVREQLFMSFYVFVLQVIDEGLITEDQEHQVGLFMREMNLEQSYLDELGSFSKLIKSKIIRQVINGEVPEAMQEAVKSTPFMLQKGEYFIWGERTVVNYYEQTTSTHYTGGYAGVGIRVARGLYFRTGGFKGKPVQTTDMKFICPGMFGLTNKHIYFYSKHKSFRIPYTKIVTMNAYENSIGIQQDGFKSRPQVFEGVDGWFTYNLIANLNKM